MQPSSASELYGFHDETFDLKNSILNFEKERNTHRQTIKDLKNQLNHYKNVSTSQQEEITTLKVKLEQTLNIYEEELSSREHIESKLEASSLTMEVMKGYLSRLGSILEDCVAMKNNLIEKNEARDREMKQLQEEIYANDVKNKVKNLSEKFDELHNQYEQEKKNREELFSQELSKLNKKYEKEIEEQKIETEMELSNCHSTIKALHKKIEEIQLLSTERLNISKETIKKLEVSREDLEKNLNASTAALQQNEKLLAELRDDISSLTNEKNNLSVEKKISHEKILELEKALENSKEELQKSQASYALFQKSVNEIEKTVNALEAEKSELEKSLIMCQKEIDHLKEEGSREKSRFEEHLSNLNTILKEKEDKISYLQSDLIIAKEFEIKLNKEIANEKFLCSEISSLTEKIKYLEYDKEKCIKELEVSKSKTHSMNLKLVEVYQDWSNEISSISSLVEEKEFMLELCEDNVSKLQEEKGRLTEYAEEIRKQLVDATEKSKQALTSIKTETKIKIETLEKENLELKDKMKAQVLKFMQSYKKKQETIRKRNEMIKEAKAYIINLKEKYFKSQQNVEDLQKLLAKNMQNDEDINEKAKVSNVSQLLEDTGIKIRRTLKRGNADLDFEHLHSQKKLVFFEDAVLSGEEILTNASSEDLFEPLTQKVCRSWEDIEETRS